MFLSSDGDDFNELERAVFALANSSNAADAAAFIYGLGAPPPLSPRVPPPRASMEAEEKEDSSHVMSILEPLPPFDGAPLLSPTLSPSPSLKHTGSYICLAIIKYRKKDTIQMIKCVLKTCMWECVRYS